MTTNTYVALDKKTAIGSIANAEFTSIPQGYTDLIVVVTGQVSSNVSLACQVNGDTGNNYSVSELFGDGATASSFRNSNNAQITVGSIGAQINSGSQWVSTLHFQNYSNTSINKTILGRTSASGTGVNAIAGLWRSNAAINSIKIMGYANASGFSSGTTFSLYGIKAWTPEVTPKATGGYVSSDSTYWYHTFLYSETFTPTEPLTCDYLVIAGGGGGGYDTGGGGGAGGLRSTIGATGGGGALESVLSLTAQAYSVTVGAGGAGALTGSRHGSNGSNSVFSTITSTAGGGGGDASSGGNSGGSGGGTRNSGSGGAGTSGQGYAGGSAGHTSAGSGGGGAGQVGANTVGTNIGGVGGNGVQITALAYPTQTGVDNGYYAGGGGGGSNTTPPKKGGLGGGGQGGTPGGINITSGAVGTGSGGGGCGGGDSTGFGNGGSGIVIVRYAK